MPQASTVSFGQVPVEYRLFGVIERHTVVTMPMTVTVTGQRGGVCSAG